ncbi:hypothetical protein ASZ78_005431 [Callipepla squamata]|uniref:Scaffolding anchor of CK1 domain-containing protein n=1 Tax=Callipepla squamata TaxID=9009 RepID=A0A226N6H2_CALSU|nr:hypothetical protein ASZ78_005431 [Callipepla squamata]
MANASQCLEEGAGRWPPRPPGPYSEAQRLALEELVAGGPEALRAFLRRERLPPFLSEPEVRAIARGAVPPAAAEEEAAEASPDASSLTYFPERSDAEPPALELGWPAFGGGAFRGLTRVEAHFQPGAGDGLYGCKEAVRRQIRAARQVIALVMDSFTDIDIFSDIQNAYSKRQVPVYILLDQDFLPYFLEMCKNLGVCPEKESLLRVRTLTGNIYYTRSGAKIIGKVHEKFIFTWTDGKLNSSNLLLLSGQVVEHFDLEFRILYAQSSPINPECQSSCGNSSIFDHLEKRAESSKEYTVESNLRAEFARLSSTPKKLFEDLDVAGDAPGGKPRNLGHSHISEEEWLSDLEAIVGQKNAWTQTGSWEEQPAVATCDVGMQTNVLTEEADTQTSVATRMAGTQTSVMLKAAATQTREDEYVETPLLHRKLSREESVPAVKLSSNSSLRSLSSSSSQLSRTSSTTSLSSLRSFEYPSVHRAEYFQKLHKERQFHYSTIRSKLSHVVDILSWRRHVPESYMNHYRGRYNLK